MSINSDTAESARAPSEVLFSPPAYEWEPYREEKERDGLFGDALTPPADTFDGLRKSAPMASASRRVTPPQALGLLMMLIALLGMAVVWGPWTPVILLIAVFAGHGLFCATVRLVLFFLGGSAGEVMAARELKEEDLPVMTILCPLYDEAVSVGPLLNSLLALDYPRDRLEIRFLLEADDWPTQRAVEDAVARLAPGKAVFPMIIPPVGPRTKPKALSVGLTAARGEIVVVYDAEDRPEADQLRVAARGFAAAPVAVACLQARLNVYNRRASWLTRLFAIEYTLLFDALLPGLARLGAPLPLGGTSNFFRKEALENIGGWDPYNVTEDADLGLRLYAAGFRSQMINSTTWEEAVAGVVPWLRQRSRWVKGYLQTYLVHVRQAVPSGGGVHALTLHGIIGGVIAASMVNSVLLFVFIVWIFDPDALEAAFPPPLAAFATGTLLFSLSVNLWTYMLAPLRRGWPGFVPFVLLAPLYWFLLCVAGGMALWSFLFRPYYWAKTAHGAAPS